MDDAADKRVLVVLMPGGESEDGDKLTCIRSDDGSELGYFFNDAAKKAGLPTVPAKGKSIVAWLHTKKVPT